MTRTTRTAVRRASMLVPLLIGSLLTAGAANAEPLGGCSLFEITDDPDNNNSIRLDPRDDRFLNDRRLSFTVGMGTFSYLDADGTTARFEGTAVENRGPDEGTEWEVVWNLSGGRMESAEKFVYTMSSGTLTPEGRDPIDAVGSFRSGTDYMFEIGFEDGEQFGSGWIAADGNNDFKFRLTCLGDAPICGDGNVDPGEECDDGNDDDTDECRNDCTLPGGMCGDGHVDPGEECDDGNNVDTDECRNDCTATMCGDGVTDLDEECDDGNDINDDACRNDCTLPKCGDGHVDPMEDCDDGNDINDDECRNDCTAPVCGDAIVDPGEECDDGNDIDTDSCTNDCMTGDVECKKRKRIVKEEVCKDVTVPVLKCENKKVTVCKTKYRWVKVRTWYGWRWAKHYYKDCDKVWKRVCKVEHETREKCWKQRYLVKEKVCSDGTIEEIFRKKLPWWWRRW